MNILILSELFYPHGGGAELATYLYAKLLSEAKFNVVVVTNRFAGESVFSRSEGFTVYRLPLFKKGDNVKYSVLQRVDVLFSSFFRKWIKWADIVYVPRYWFSAIPLAKSLGKPVVTHLHDYIPICPMATKYDIARGSVCGWQGFCCLSCITAYEKRKRGLTKTFSSVFLNTTAWHYLRACVGLSDLIFCVSEAQKDIIVKFMPQLRDKVSVVYNPMPSLSPIDVVGQDFGYFGGPNHLKGFHVLLDALRYKNVQGSSSVIVHGTKFSNSDRNFKRLLNNLSFIPYEKLSNLEYEQLYRKIRAVVVPSIWHEPLPYVVTESILYGRLILASHVGGIPELLKGCKGVFLFQPNDYSELARLITLVKRMSEEEILDMTSYNRSFYSKKYDNIILLKNFLNLIENTI